MGEIPDDSFRMFAWISDNVCHPSLLPAVVLLGVTCFATLRSGKVSFRLLCMADSQQEHNQKPIERLYYFPMASIADPCPAQFHIVFCIRLLLIRRFHDSQKWVAVDIFQRKVDEVRLRVDGNRVCMGHVE